MKKNLVQLALNLFFDWFKRTQRSQFWVHNRSITILVRLGMQVHFFFWTDSRCMFCIVNEERNLQMNSVNQFCFTLTKLNYYILTFYGTKTITVIFFYKIKFKREMWLSFCMFLCEPETCRLWMVRFSIFIDLKHQRLT